jgi:hypothetical protein
MNIFIKEMMKNQPEINRTVHYNQKTLPSDEEIVSYVIQEQNMKSDLFSQEENIADAVSNYLSLVRSRELQIQNLMELISSSNFTIEENLESIKDANSLSDSLYFMRKSELTDLKITYSKLEKKLDESRANLEIEILDVGDKNFRNFYKQNLRDKERKMERVYGPRSINEVKGKYKRDITDATVMSEHRKIRDYQAAKDLLEESKKQIESLKKELENDVSKAIKEAEKKVDLQSKKIMKIKEQYEAVVDAERQLAKHIKDSIKNKEEDVKDKTAKLFYDLKLNQHKEELEATKQAICETEDELRDKLNQTIISDIESQSDNNGKLQTQEEINQELYDEDLNLRKKFDELKEALKKLKKEINPNLKEMEEERAELEEAVKQSKASLESLYGKYTEIKKGINLTKNEIINRQQDEDINLGSLSRLDKKDEIDKEIEIMRVNKKSVIFEQCKELRRSGHQLNLSTSRSKHSMIEKVKEKSDIRKEKLMSLGTSYKEKMAVSQQTNLLEVSVKGTDSNYTVHLEDASPFEIEFFEKIICLLEGKELFVPTKLAEQGSNAKRERRVFMTDDLHHLLILNENQFYKFK